MASEMCLSFFFAICVSFCNGGLETNLVIKSSCRTFFRVIFPVVDYKQLTITKIESSDFGKIRKV